jgi:hypothetical protein
VLLQVERLSELRALFRGSRSRMSLRCCGFGDCRGCFHAVCTKVSVLSAASSFTKMAGHVTTTCLRRGCSGLSSALRPIQEEGKRDRKADPQQRRHD